MKKNNKRSVVFDDTREDNLKEKLALERKEKAEYAKKVGQLTMQVDWLKKNLKKHLDLTTRVNLVQNLLKTKELPVGFKKKLNEFAALLSITRSNFHLVTVKKQKYYVYRYEGKLNGIENAVVLLSYPEKAFGNPKALRAFLSTDVSLSVGETLSYYAGRWPIEIFFRQCKDKLALDSYQIRSAQGIRRYWLLMSMAHFMCVAGTGEFCSFEKGYHRIESIIQTEKYQYLFQCAKESNDFDAFMKLAG